MTLKSPRTNNRKKIFNVEESDVQSKIELKTLHFNFTESFAKELAHFAEIHRNDDRKVFKSSWNDWIKTTSITELVSAEVEIQRQRGFSGDVLDKMFKSARYYFRKKPTTPPAKTQRKQYISLCPQFLAQIDKHSLEIIKTNTINHDSGKCLANISPARAYTDFCDTNQDVIYEQIEHLVELLEYVDICEKMKKTYKNRFHLMKITVENMSV
jgi:hypothetical protein